MVNGVKMLKAVDISRIVDIWREFSMFLYKDEPNQDYLCSLWSGLIKQGTAAIFYLEDKDTNITGILVGIKSPHNYIPILMAIESMLYIKPEAKGHGIKLIKAFEEWAYYNQCSIIKLSSAAGAVTSQRDAKLYEHLGYKKIEEHYIKEV